jgi:hypothetical protein
MRSDQTMNAGSRSTPLLESFANSGLRGANYVALLCFRRTPRQSAFAPKGGKRMTAMCPPKSGASREGDARQTRPLKSVETSSRRAAGLMFPAQLMSPASPPLSGEPKMRCFHTAANAL